MGRLAQSWAERARDSWGVFPRGKDLRGFWSQTIRDLHREHGEATEVPSCRLNASFVFPSAPPTPGKARPLLVPILLPVPGFSGSPEPSSDPKDQKPEPGDAMSAARLEQVASRVRSVCELPWARSRARARAYGGRGAPREDPRGSGCVSLRDRRRACLCARARVLE